MLLNTPNKYVWTWVLNFILTIHIRDLVSCIYLFADVWGEKGRFGHVTTCWVTRVQVAARVKTDASNTVKDAQLESHHGGRNYCKMDQGQTLS